MNGKKEAIGLTQAEVARFGERLRELRDRLTDEVDREMEGIREDLNAAGNLSSVPIHLGDAAPSQLDADIIVMENERAILQQAHEAIERIAEGTFGECLECGQAIARERLEELPFTPFCFACATALEDRAIRRGSQASLGELREVEFPGEGSGDVDVISAALGAGLEDQDDDWIDEGLAEEGQPGGAAGGAAAGKRSGRQPGKE